MSRTRLPKAYCIEPPINNVSQHLDLSRLRTRVGEKPRTKVGQVRQAWPEIKDLLAAGHSLKDIWAWLNEIGLEIGYARLSHYISQLRLRDQAAQSQIQDLRRGLCLPAEQTAGSGVRARGDGAETSRLIRCGTCANNAQERGVSSMALFQRRD